MKTKLFAKLTVAFALMFVAQSCSNPKDKSKESFAQPKPKIPEIEMVDVEGGTFLMGSNEEPDAIWETPEHSVTLSDFSIGKYEVTQDLWEAVMGTNPSQYVGDNLPVDNVSWLDIEEFISTLNALTGKNYRLPTEAEWEFAARGGNLSRGYKYSGSNDIDSVAWIFNFETGTYPVGTKAPNELGIYDMSGNVCEWCQDWFGENYYSSSPAKDPTGPNAGACRVFRGSRGIVYNRDLSHSSYISSNLGFRIAL